MKTIKTAEMPVGAAVSRLVELKFAQRFFMPRDPARKKEIDNLVEALNAFQVDLAFDCDTTDIDANGIPDAIEAAQTALDVLLCDAETQCCRIADKAASEAGRPRRITSSRGD